MNTSQAVYLRLRSKIYDALDADAVSTLTLDRLREQLRVAVDTLVEKEGLQVPALLRVEFVDRLIDEIKGLGPLQPLVDDDAISDIMVNGPNCVYIEKGGLLTRTAVTFLDEAQLLGIAKRIAAQVGRRVDESQPMCDARLQDGSRVNIAIPPIALDGTTISIRKFGRKDIGLEQLIGFGAMSREMAGPAGNSIGLSCEYPYLRRYGFW